VLIVHTEAHTAFLAMGEEQYVQGESLLGMVGGEGGYPAYASLVPWPSYHRCVYNLASLGTPRPPLEPAHCYPRTDGG